MAEPMWEPDGTQPPPAPKAWDDPVAGLVTGAAYESEPFQIETAQPTMPDMDEVRRAVDAALAEEDEPAAPPKIPSPRRQPTSAEPPGIVPPNPRAGWPRSPSVRQLPGLRPRQPPPPPRRGQVRRSQGFSAGIGAVIVIVVVVVVIVATIINSLLETITTLFN